MASNNIPNTWLAKRKDTSWVIQTKDGKTVAMIKNTGNDEAYAKLIAASPYMLESLKAASALIGDDDLPDNGELSGAAVCDMIRSAVEIAE